MAGCERGSNPSNPRDAISKYDAASPLGDRAGVVREEPATLDEPQMLFKVSPSRVVASLREDSLLSVERTERLRSITSGALGVADPRSIPLDLSTSTELRRLSRTDSGAREEYPEWRLSDSGGRVDALDTVR